MDNSLGILYSYFHLLIQDTIEKDIFMSHCFPHKLRALQSAGYKHYLNPIEEFLGKLTKLLFLTVSLFIQSKNTGLYSEMIAIAI